GWLNWLVICVGATHGSAKKRIQLDAAFNIMRHITNKKNVTVLEKIVGEAASNLAGGGVSPGTSTADGPDTATEEEIYDRSGMDSSTEDEYCVPRSLADKCDDQKRILMDMRADLISMSLDELKCRAVKKEIATSYMVEQLRSLKEDMGKHQQQIEHISTSGVAGAHVCGHILQEKLKEEKVNIGSSEITKSAELFDIFDGYATVATQPEKTAPKVAQFIGNEAEEQIEADAEENKGLEKHGSTMTAGKSKSANAGELPGSTAEGDAVPQRTVYVGNIEYKSPPRQLHEHFDMCGIASSITIIVDKRTGRPKGSAFIEFMDEQGAINALLMDGVEFCGRRLRARQKYPNSDPGIAVSPISGFADRVTDLSNIALCRNGVGAKLHQFASS
ncbi:unnamed protein product, partial [Prorocentrum cordatum]